MIVNGKIAEFAPMTLLEYLRHNKYNPAHVVVERNRENCHESKEIPL